MVSRLVESDIMAMSASDKSDTPDAVLAFASTCEACV